MVTLQGEHISLRALEPEDLDFVHRIENDETIWELSATQTPYSKFVIKRYLENAHKDIYEVKQLRLVIQGPGQATLGLIDLFDFDAHHQRAGVGILIAEDEHRNKGYGAQALKLLCNYAFKRLHLHQLYANIAADNTASIQLFSKLGFEQAGVKKDWNFQLGGFKDELLFQKINKDT